MSILPDVHTAVANPSKKQAGVRMMKGRRIGPRRFLTSLILITLVRPFDT
jgi:hypothetical protein